MHFAQDCVVSTLVKRSSKKAGVLQIVQSDRAIAFESQVNEVEVLRDDWVRGSRKVERKAVFDAGSSIRIYKRVDTNKFPFTCQDNAARK